MTDYSQGEFVSPCLKVPSAPNTTILNQLQKDKIKIAMTVKTKINFSKQMTRYKTQIKCSKIDYGLKPSSLGHLQ